MAEVAHMYGHRWVPYHDLDTDRKGFWCADCGAFDFQLRTEWDWDENMPSCSIPRRVNVKGENR